MKELDELDDFIEKSFKPKKKNDIPKEYWKKLNNEIVGERFNLYNSISSSESSVYNYPNGSHTHSVGYQSDLERMQYVCECGCKVHVFGRDLSRERYMESITNPFMDQYQSYQIFCAKCARCIRFVNIDIKFVKFDFIS